MKPNRMEKYIVMIRNFLDRHLTVEDFERQYLATFKSEHAGMTIAEFAILETLFSAVDAYCPDPDIRSDEDLDEEQLRKAAQDTLNELKKL